MNPDLNTTAPAVEPQTIDELMKLLAEKPEEHFALTTDDGEPTEDKNEELVLN